MTIQAAAPTTQTVQERGAPLEVGAARPVRERPILFSAPMVRALRAVTKTQTRRLVTTEWNHMFVRSELSPYVKRPFQREHGERDVVTFSEPYAQLTGEPAWFYSWGNSRWLRSPYGVPGDRLWVRETWATDSALDTVKPSHLDSRETIEYVADGEIRRSRPVGIFDRGKTRVSIFMPHWASRITLEVTEVRVQRLQDISEVDAFAEGIPLDLEPRQRYAELWDSINGAGSWDANPWVWAVSFRVLP